MDTLPPELVKYLQDQAAAEAARLGKPVPAKGAAPWTSAATPATPWTSAGNATPAPGPSAAQNWTAAGSQPQAEVWPRPQPKPGLSDKILESLKKDWQSLKQDFGGKPTTAPTGHAGEAFKPQAQAAPTPQGAPEMPTPQPGKLGKFAGKVGGPMGVASLGLMLAPVASSIGESIASKIDPLSTEYDRIAAEKAAKNKPKQPPIGGGAPPPPAATGTPPVAAQPSPEVQAQAQTKQLVDPLMALQGTYQALPDATAEFSAPSVPAQAPATASSGSNSQLLEAIAAILSNPSRQAATYTPDASSTAAIDALPDVKPEVVQPKKGFVEGLKRFISAGNPNYNPNRLDELNQEAANVRARAANAVTPRTQAKASIGSADVQASRAATLASGRSTEEAGGMSPQDKFMLDLVGGSYAQQERTAGAKELAGVEQSNAMERLRAGAAAQRTTPAGQQQALTLELAKQFPDMFGPQGLATMTGQVVSPEVLNSITNARGKNDPTAILISELLRDKLAERKSKTAPTLKTNSLAPTK